MAGIYKLRTADIARLVPPVAVAAGALFIFLQTCLQIADIFRESSSAAAPQTVARPAKDPSVMLKEILQANIFKDDGSARDSGAGSGKYDLRGTFAGTDNTPSYAILMQAGGAEKIYRIGDKLAGGVTIDAIYADRIVLSDHGKQQVLQLRPVH